MKAPKNTTEKPSKAVEKKVKAPTKTAKTLDINLLFDRACLLMSTKGLSLRKSCELSGMHRRDFHNIINEDESRADQYARAREEREDYLLDEILEIADDDKGDELRLKVVKNADGSSMTLREENREFVNRSKLKVEARQWALSKMNPKKFGNKLELDGEVRERLSIVLDLGDDEVEIDKGLRSDR